MLLNWKKLSFIALLLVFRLTKTKRKLKYRNAFSMKVINGNKSYLSWFVNSKIRSLIGTSSTKINRWEKFWLKDHRPRFISDSSVVCSRFTNTKNLWGCSTDEKRVFLNQTVERIEDHWVVLRFWLSDRCLLFEFTFFTIKLAEIYAPVA